MKSILIVTEQYTIGGLETHIRGELKYLLRHGDVIHFVVGEQFDRRLLPPGISSFTRVRFEAKSTVKGLLSSVDQIRKVIRQYDIDLVHVHPFSSIVPACLASALESVPYIITLHGPASLAVYNDIELFLLHSIIMPSAARVVVVSSEIERLVQPFVPQERLYLLPNGVDLEEIKQRGKAIEENKDWWLVVSRIDELKLKGIHDFISKAGICGLSSVAIVGDGPARGELESRLKSERGVPQVKFLGARTDIPELMHASRGVAGMGRVLLEGLASGKPVVLVGYDGVKGLVDRSLVERAAEANFSGRGLPVISDSTFCSQYRQWKFESLYGFLRDHYNEPDLWANFRDDIENLSIEPRDVMVAIYHQLAAHSDVLGGELIQESPGVFSILEDVVVSGQLFDERAVARISLLSQRKIVNETSRLSELVERQLVTLDNRIGALRKELDLKTTELDAIKNQLEQSRNENADIKMYQEALLRENKMMRRSFSWRVTWPFRGLGYFVKDPVNVSYAGMRAAYWALPSRLRRSLQGVRHRTIRWAHRLGVRSGQVAVSQAGDISWDKFSDIVLSNRAKFRGIYIIYSTIAWHSSLYQRPQHMAMAMSRLGYLVIYKTPRLGGDMVNGFRKIDEQLWITADDRVDRIQDAIRSIYSTDSVIEIDRIDSFPSGCLVYEYIDHIDPQISGDTENIRRLERLKTYALNGHADLVIASAQALYDEVAGLVQTEHVALVPNGVDTRHYRDPELRLRELPANLAMFSNKYPLIVGYFGALAPWLWYDMLRSLIAQRTDLGFVFIGPDYYEGASQLPDSENLLYLGSVDYSVLPAYARVFDVCLIPFSPGEVAQTTSPLKLFEYFALEKPVVVTSDMRECVQYEAVFHGKSTAEISAALDKAISVKDDSKYRTDLHQLADENDWDERARRYDCALRLIGSQAE